MSQSNRYGWTDLERYLDWVGEPDSNGCRLWLGGLSAKGYGKFKAGGRTWRAHVWGYHHLKRPVPPGFLVRHRCDNPPCQSLWHLCLGTHADNMADMVTRARQARGEDNGRALLTQQQADDIRKQYALGGVTQRELGIHFGISRQTISLIVLGKEWIR